MLALIAGTGGLPPAILAHHPDALVFGLDGFSPEVRVDQMFRLVKMFLLVTK